MDSPESLAAASKPVRNARLQPRMIGVSLLMAAIVGTVLTLANQSSALLNGKITWLLLGRIGVNFLVPFVVSLTSTLLSCSRK